MSTNPEFDALRRQFATILRNASMSCHSAALVMEQYANIIENGTIPSAHTITQLSLQMPQTAMSLQIQASAAAGGGNTTTNKKKKSGKDGNDFDVVMFDVTSPTGEEGETKKRKRQSAKEKKPKDPNAPKRPPSAYLLYQNAVRKEVRESMPTSTYNEVLSEIAKMWADLPANEKKSYQDATDLAKGEYEKLKADYDATHGPNVDANTSGTAAKETTKAESSKTGATVHTKASTKSAAAPAVPAPAPTAAASTSAPSKPEPKKKKESLGKAAVPVPAPPPVIESSEDEDSDASEDGSETDDSDADATASDEEVEQAVRMPPKKKSKKEKTPPPPPPPVSKKDKKEKASSKRK
ncbi:hypothetical protein FRB91_005422 [Serendipita sp. 411]|nr:hypothetical protein FRB91_005422 [Serendipita sp. 411]KAG9051941.1 hypothetical protein FS842_010778 [Serendipita sp. 407]